MTIIETAVKKIESTDFRNAELKTGDIFSANGKAEIVIETYYEEKRLIRFRTARREGDGRIAESHYSVNEKTGKEHQDYSGICYGDDNNPHFHASERYFELNRFLEEQER